MTQIIIFILSLCGFWVARHIHNHKTKNTPLICPGKFDCHTVVHSDYSKFLGVPVEFLGMMYYALISITYLVLTFVPDILSHYLTFCLDLLSTGALIFSFYLIAVQIFILKKGCSWCFISALISALIFILVIF